MKFKEVAEIVLRNLAGGDVSQDFHIKEEEVYVRMAQMIPFLMRKDFYETYQIDGGDFNTINYTTFAANLYKSDTDNESYLILPSAPLIIHGRGTPELSYLKDRSASFTYIDIAQYRNYISSGILNELDGIVFFYEFCDCSKEHRLVLVGADDCMEKVRVRMVQSGDYDMDAEVPIHIVEPLVQGLRAWYNFQEKDNNDKVNDDVNNKV